MTTFQRGGLPDKYASTGHGNNHANNYNKMKNLIVGKNSVIVKKMLTRFPDLGFAFDIVSYSELESLTHRYNKCYIFSYSLREKDNQIIIDWCCVNCMKVYYISSSSVIVAKHGELYKYPKIKMLAENYGSAHYNNFYIRRLGYVVDNKIKSRFIRYVTEITDVHQVLMSDEDAKIINKFKINSSLDEKSFKSKIILYYSLLQYYIMPASIILRPFDIILKILNIQSYGYTSLGDRLWTYMKK